MTSIVFPFINYPAWRQRWNGREARYFAGTAVCKADEPVRVVEIIGGQKFIRVPLHRSFRWKAERIDIEGLSEFDFDDAFIFIRGRHGFQVQTLLTAAMLRDAGEISYAETYQRLGVRS